MYKFSVIIPCFNCSDYIEETIDSVINQTTDFKDTKIILIDDLSTDDTLIKLEKYSKYDNIIILKNKVNIGVSKSRNLALEHVDSKYFFFLDSDDYISEECLYFVEQNFLMTKEKIITIPLQMFGDLNRGVFANNKYDNGNRVIDAYGDYKNYTQLHIGSCFFRTENCINFRFNEKFNSGADSLYVSKAIMKNGSFSLENRGTYFYRKEDSNKNSVSRTGWKKKEKYYTFLIENSLYLLDKFPNNHFIQSQVIYSLRLYFDNNDWIEVLNEEEKLTFKTLFIDILKRIDDDIIMSMYKVNMAKKEYFLHIKYRENFEFTPYFKILDDKLLGENGKILRKKIKKYIYIVKRGPVRVSIVCNLSDDFVVSGKILNVKYTKPINYWGNEIRSYSKIQIYKIPGTKYKIFFKNK